MNELIDSILTIALYNGEKDFIKNIITKCEECIKSGKTFSFRDVSKEVWHSEEHVLYMVIANHYGEWGTSIRSAWIKKPYELLNDIKETIKENWNCIEYTEDEKGNKITIDYYEKYGIDVYFEEMEY